MSAPKSERRNRLGRTALRAGLYTAGACLVYWVIAAYAGINLGGSMLYMQFGQSGCRAPMVAGAQAAGGEAPVVAINTTCPIKFPRMSFEDMRRGKRPYLLGGQRPNSTTANRTDNWALGCQYKNGPICPSWVVQSLVNRWLDRQHELALTMSPCDLWPFIAGRTLFLMGDSMMLDMFKAASCFMSELWPSLQHTELAPGNKQLQAALSKIITAQCARLVHNTSICYIRVDQGQDMYGRVLPLLPQVGKPTDLLVLNFGLHHWKDYKDALNGFVRYYKENKQKLPQVLWQQTSAQHFKNDAGSGEYSGGKPPFQCVKIQGYKVVGGGVLQLEPGHNDRNNILRGGWRNSEADPLMRQAGIPILPSWNETLHMDTMHRDNGNGHECTHYCHPSAPQSWLIALYRALRQHYRQR